MHATSRPERVLVSSACRCPGRVRRPGLFQVIVTDCSAGGEFTLAETFTVGDGPLGLDMRKVGDDTLIATTCFNDNSLHLITLAAGGNSQQSINFAACDSPSDVSFLSDGNLGIACNGDSTIVYVPLSELGFE